MRLQAKTTALQQPSNLSIISQSQTSAKQKNVSTSLERKIQKQAIVTNMDNDTGNFTNQRQSEDCYGKIATQQQQSRVTEGVRVSDRAGSDATVVQQLNQVIVRMNTVLTQYQQTNTHLNSKCGSYEQEIARLKAVLDKHGIVEDPSEIRVMTGHDECYIDESQPQ